MDPDTEKKVPEKLIDALRQAGHVAGEPTTTPSSGITLDASDKWLPKGTGAPSKLGIFKNLLFKGANIGTAIYAIYEVYQQIASMDNKDPSWREKATRLVAHLIDEYGLPMTATILGGIVGGAFSGGPGSIPGVILGLGSGVLADLWLGDDAREIVNNLVDQLFGKTKDTRQSIPGGNTNVELVKERDDETTDDNIVTVHSMDLDESVPDEISDMHLRLEKVINVSPV